MMEPNKKTMETWVLYAILSMVFAGVTSIFAKFGLERVDADLGLVIRTSIIFVLVVLTALAGKVFAGLPQLTGKEIGLLLASGLTAYLSWLFYFRALKDGLVTYVTAIDKSSIVVTLALSFLLLKEPMKPQVLIGGGLILAGMLVLVWK
ncbi:MAG: EamA family transporter [Lewinella sp.]|nr:EamA family transporter [Lewinella sp.]